MMLPIAFSYTIGTPSVEAALSTGIQNYNTNAPIYQHEGTFSSSLDGLHNTTSSTDSQSQTEALDELVQNEAKTSSFIQ